MHSGGGFGGGGRGGGGFTSNSNSGNFGGGSYQYYPQNNSSRNTFVNRSSYVVVGTPGSVYSGTRAYSAPPPVLVSQGPKISAWLTLRPLVDVGIVVVMLYMYVFCFNSLHLQVSYRESRLLTVNTFFVKEIEVKPVGSVPFPLESTVYTFSSKPALSHGLHWREEFHHELVRAYGYESTSLFLNKGSSVALSYQLDTDGLFLVVLRGADRLVGWKKDPRGFGDTELFQDISRGGSASFSATASSEYFIALGNLQDHSAEVLNLSLSVNSLMYDTSYASTRCTLRSGSSCWVAVPMFSGKRVLVASPDTLLGNMEAYKVDVRYHVRLLSLLIIIGLTWLATRLLKAWAIAKANRDYASSQSQQRSDPFFTDPPLLLPTIPGRRPSFFERVFGYGQSSEVPPSAFPAPQIPAPLPTAWVPSNSSSLAPTAAEREEETLPSAPPLEVGEGMGGGECKPTIGDACSICMDAKKDAILIDCGHRATCMNCAQLLLKQRPALCPICRKEIRQVIKIFDA